MGEGSGRAVSLGSIKFDTVKITNQYEEEEEESSEFNSEVDTESVSRQ